MEDAAILELYFARNELAIVETDRKYGGYCYSVANRILNSKEDSDETVSDTFWHTWNVIPPQRPSFLKLFLAKVTRNLAFSRWRKLSAAKRGGGETELVLEELAGCIPGSEQIDDQLGEAIPSVSACAEPPPLYKGEAWKHRNAVIFRGGGCMKILPAGILPS